MDGGAADQRTPHVETDVTVNERECDGALEIQFDRAITSSSPPRRRRRLFGFALLELHGEGERERGGRGRGRGREGEITITTPIGISNPPAASGEAPSYYVLLL